MTRGSRLVHADQILAVELVPCGQAVLNGHRFAGDAGDQLGDLVHQGQFHPLGAAHVAHGGLGLHAVEGGNLGDLALAKALTV